MANILSIDGGGIKGVFAASFLKEVEAKCNIKICDKIYIKEAMVCDVAPML